MKLEDGVKIAFEAMQVIRFYNGENHIESYDELSDERKNQLMRTAKAVMRDRHITARELHNVWSAAKLQDGWRYGAITDRDNKIHNCLVPFDELNVYQQMKDDLFITIIKTVINTENS